MLALVSTIAGKSIQVFCMVFLLSFSGATRTVLHALVSPVTSLSSREEAEKDTLSDKDDLKEEEKDPRTEIKKYKSSSKKRFEKRPENLKISISDKGVRIGSEDGREVFLDIDKDGLSAGIEDALDGLKGVKIQLDDIGDISEYIDFDFLDIEDRDFKVVRNKDILRFGDDVHIGRNELVRGDVVVFFADIDIDGKVTGDVVNIFGDVHIGSSAIVNGEVVSVLGTLTEDSNAHIRGETVEVWGHSTPMTLPFFAFGGGVFRVIGKFVSFIVGVLLLLLILYFLPDRMQKSSDYIFGSFFKSLGVGVLVIFIGGAVVGLLAVILSITIIGIPVAILLVLSLVALIMVGYFVSAFALGHVIVEKININGDSMFVKGIIGLFALTIFGLLSGMMWFAPYLIPARIILKSLSAFLNFLALFAGTGAFILSKGGMLMLNKRPSLPEPE